MSELRFECPTTGYPVATGIDIDPVSYASLAKIVTQVRCPYCPQPHVLSGLTTWLADGDTPAEWPFGSAGD